jgi:hypothetical protein
MDQTWSIEAWQTGEAFGEGPSGSLSKAVVAGWGRLFDVLDA